MVGRRLDGATPGLTKRFNDCDSELARVTPDWRVMSSPSPLLVAGAELIVTKAWK
jgi:hypothetical protein